MKPNILRMSMAMIAMAVIMSGCLKSPSDTIQSTPKTYISVMHLALTAPSLDIFFDDLKVSTIAFAPGNITPIYNVADRGTFSIKFKKAALDSIVAEVPSALYDSLKFYTIFIYNPQANGAVKAVRIKDDFSAVQPNSGKPYYRFFHASPNSGAVDLYMDNVKIESGRMLADNSGFELLNKFSETTSGLHTFLAKLAGTNTVIATLDNTELRAGNSYTIYLKGSDGGTGSNQLALGILQAAN